MSRPLEGRRGIVTGGAQGIGREIAVALQEAGAHLALIDVGDEIVRATAGELARDDAPVHPLVADVSDEAQVDATFDEAARLLGGIDFLVNNAGIRRVAPFMEHTLADWQRTLDVDLTGPFLCSRAAIRHMLPAGGGGSSTSPRSPATSR